MQLVPGAKISPYDNELARLASENDPVVCPFFMSGCCRYGSTCWYYHPPNQNPETGEEFDLEIPGDAECCICL